MDYTYNPWNSPGQNTGVGSLSLLQGIFPTQGSNPGLPHCGWILHQLSHKGSPRILERVANKSPSSQSYGFSSSHVWIWELDCKESWVLKNWQFWTVVLEKAFESQIVLRSLSWNNTPTHSLWTLSALLVSSFVCLSFFHFAGPDLSCGTWDLSLLWSGLLAEASRIWFPDQGLNLSPLH